MVKYKQEKLKHFWLVVVCFNRPEFKIYKFYEHCMTQLWEDQCEFDGNEKQWRELLRETELRFFPNRKRYVQSKIGNYFHVLPHKRYKKEKSVKHKISF